MQLSAHILASLALSLPLVSAFTGDATFYDPDGVGSCGSVINADSPIVAVSRSHDGNCGRNIQVNFNGKSVTATVADTCQGCGTDGIDLSRSKFVELGGDVNAGRISVTWDFV